MLQNFSKTFFIEHLQVAASPRRVFQIKANRWSAFFPRRNFFPGVLKIYIANKNLLIQTKK